MQLEVWCNQEISFFGMSKSKNPYRGPYPTFVAHLHNYKMAVAANNRIGLFDLESQNLDAVYNVKSGIRMLKSANRLLLSVSSDCLHLLNQRLELVRYLELNGQQILSVYGEDASFRVLYTGYHLRNEQFIKFKKSVTNHQGYAEEVGFFIQNSNLFYQRLSQQPVSMKLEQQICESHGLQTYCSEDMIIVELGSQFIVCLSKNLQKLYIVKRDDSQIIRSGCFLYQVRENSMTICKLRPNGLEKVGRTKRYQSLTDIVEVKGQVYVIYGLKTDSYESRFVEICELEVEDLFADEQQPGQTQLTGNELVDLINHKFEQIYNTRPLSNIYEQLNQSSHISPAKTPDNRSEREINLSIVATEKNIRMEDANFKRVKSLMNQSIQKFPLSVGELFERQKQVTKSQLIQYLTTQNSKNNRDKITKLVYAQQDLTLQTYRYLIDTDPVLLLKTYYKKHCSAQEYQSALCEYVDKTAVVAPELIQQACRENPSLMDLLYEAAKDKQKIKNVLRGLTWKLKLRDINLNLLEFQLNEQQRKLIVLLHPEFAVEELHTPIELFGTILKLYFNKAEELDQTINIEDQTIYLTNPRNMLNVLLYISQIFNFDPVICVKIYLKTLINEGLIEMTEEIVYKQNILEVCGLSIQLLVNIIKEIEKQLYLRQPFAKTQFEIILQLIKQKQFETYKSKAIGRMDLMTRLENDHLDFSLQEIYLMEEKKNGWELLSRIIDQEDTSLVCNLNIQDLYEKIWMIQTGDKLQNYTKQLLLLTEKLIKKCIQCNLYFEAYEYMLKVRPRLKLSTLVFFIINYCKNENREVRQILQQICKGDHDQLFEIITSLVSKQNITPADSSVEMNEDFRCEFSEFKQCAGMYSVCEDNAYIKNQDFITIVYYNLQLARCLVHDFQFLKGKELQKLVDQMKSSKLYTSNILKVFPADHSKSILDELPLVFKIPVLEKWTPDQTKGDIKSADKKKYVKRNSEEFMLRAGEESSPSIRSEKMISKHNRRHNSHPPPQDEQNDVRELKSIIKESESPNEYIRQFYYRNTIQKLIDLLNKCKLPLQLYYLDQLLEIQEYQLQFDFKNIFTFEFVSTDDLDQAFKIIRLNLIYHLNTSTFWIISFLVRKILGEHHANEVAFLFLKKLLQNPPVSPEAKTQMALVREQFSLRFEHRQILVDLEN